MHDGKVWAYNVRGEKHRVPPHWIGHPVIKGWRLTPSQRARESATKKSTSPKASRKTPTTGDNTTKEQ